MTHDFIFGCTHRPYSYKHSIHIVSHEPVITDARTCPYMGVLDLSDKIWVAGGLQGFCENLPEAFPSSDRANDSSLQDRPTAGQAQVYQWW